MPSLPCFCHQHGLVLKHPAGASGHLIHSDHLFQCSIYHEKSQPYFKEQADVLGAMNGFVQENLTGFNVLKLYVRGKLFPRKSFMILPITFKSRVQG